MSVVTFSDEWPRWRESHVIAHRSQAGVLRTCGASSGTSAFSCVGPSRGIPAAAIAGYRLRRSTIVGERKLTLSPLAFWRKDDKLPRFDDPVADERRSRPAGPAPARRALRTAAAYAGCHQSSPDEDLI